MEEIIFDKILMKNVRCHDELEIDFKLNALTAIVGKNGAGKSTIFQALNTGLFGDPGEKSVTVGDMVNKKVGKNMEIIIRLHKLVDGKKTKYEIRKYHSHKKFSNKTVLIEGEDNDISGTTTTDTHKIIESLILPKNVFKNTVYFSQQVKDFFTALGDADQKRIFDAIMDLAEWKLYYGNSTDKISLTETEIATVKQCIIVIDNVIPEKETMIKTLEEQKKTFHKDHKEKIVLLKDEIKQLEMDDDGFRNARSKVQIDEDVYGQLLADKGDVTDKIASVKTNADDEIEKVEQEKLKYMETVNLKAENTINSEKTVHEDKYSKLKETCDTAVEVIMTELNVIAKDEVGYKLLQEKGAAVGQLNTDKASKLKIATDIKSEAQSTQTKFNSSVEAFDKKESDFKMLIVPNAKCPTCDQEMDAEKRQQVKGILEEELKVLQNEKTTLMNEFNNFKTKFAEAKKEYDTVCEGEEGMLDSFNDKIKKRDDEVEVQSSELETEKNKLQNNLRLERVSTLEKIQEIKTRIAQDVTDETLEQINKDRLSVEKINADATKQEKELNVKLQEIDKQITETVKLRNLINEISDDIKRVSMELENKHNQITNCEEEVFDSSEIVEQKKQLTEKKKERTKQTKILTTLNKTLKMLEFWKEAFSDRGIKSMLLDSAIPFLNKRIKEELERIVPGKFIVSFDTMSETKAGDVRDKFNVNILNTETGADSHKLLSGGEKRIIDVCALLSLRSLTENLYGKRLNLLLMDEVLDSLDTENSSIFCQVLKKLSEGMSINLITHELKVDVECDNIYRL